MSGWRGSTRKKRLPPNWQALRAEVLRRDRRRCQHVRFDTGAICGAYANQVDHIVQGADDDRPSALQSLCAHHHKTKSSSEGGRAAAVAAERRKAATKRRHPGLMP